jgi:hypothetical protein
MHINAIGEGIGTLAGRWLDLVSRADRQEGGAK